MYLLCIMMANKIFQLKKIIPQICTKFISSETNTHKYTTLNIIHDFKYYICVCQYHSEVKNKQVQDVH